MGTDQKRTYAIWQRYENEKARVREALECGQITADEYDQQIKDIAKRLRL